MIFLVIVFMLFYVDGHQFFLSHRLSLAQADGSVTRQFVFLPVQSDITTIISLLASSARLASTLWVVGIDLRCVFLFMERGGVTFEGLKSVIGGSLLGEFINYLQGMFKPFGPRLPPVPAEEKLRYFCNAPGGHPYIGFHIFSRLGISYLGTW